MLGDLLTDKVSLVKPDGKRFDNIGANVQQGMIFITDTSLPIEDGDRILRQLPNGVIEHYLILDTGYMEGVHGIPSHYQMKVRKESAISEKTPAYSVTDEGLFIAETRLAELQSVKSGQFDLTKLIALCQEMNKCFSSDCVLAVAMLTRAVVDHVPPIFGSGTFSEVANNYAGSKSFKQAMQNLENSSRKIADLHLHTQIRKNEVLPNRVQVNFAREIDLLLSEIVRILR